MLNPPPATAPPSPSTRRWRRSLGDTRPDARVAINCRPDNPQTVGQKPPVVVEQRRVVSHYRDSDQLEADVVIEARDGRWIAAEVKLGGERDIEQAAQSLKRLRDKVDTSRVGEPSKLLIITATGYGYDRPDGTSVVPITALGP